MMTVGRWQATLAPYQEGAYPVFRLYPSHTHRSLSLGITIPLVHTPHQGGSPATCVTRRLVIQRWNQLKPHGLFLLTCDRQRISPLEPGNGRLALARATYRRLSHPATVRHHTFPFPAYWFGCCLSARIPNIPSLCLAMLDHLSASPKGRWSPHD